MQLQQQEAEVNSLDMDVVVVTFESEAIAKNYVSDTQFSWPILIDSTRELYADYGMNRGSRWAIYGPGSWWGYLKLIFRGRKIKLPTDDVRQLGGDVLIDPAGIVRLHHVGQTPVDRPTIESLMDVVRDHNSTGG